jgi:hypothetical protein
VKQQQKGIAQLSGFVEQVSADKIKIAVSGIKFVTPTVDLNFPEMKEESGELHVQRYCIKGQFRVLGSQVRMV